MDNIIDKPNFKVSIDEGVFITYFYNEISMEGILSAEAQTIKLMNEKNIAVAPFIVVVNSIPEDHVKFGVSDFGKIISFIKIFDRCSGMWVVSPKENSNTLGELMNKTFLGNRIQYVETLEQAKAEANALKNSKTSLLEQDET